MIAKFLSARVVPIVVIDNPAHAIPLADALLAGGMKIIEITLRTPQALDAISKIVKERPEMTVVAGTVLNIEEARGCLSVGAQIAVSPGFDLELSQWCARNSLQLIPGVASASEIMAAAKAGHKLLKFFPAKAVGGIPALAAMCAPFAKLELFFLPTGGLSLADVPEVLSHPFIAAMGGTWIAPFKDISSGNWKEITARASEVVQLSSSY